LLIITGLDSVFSRKDISRRGSRHFHLGGHWRGQFATRGTVNGLCRAFRKRPEKFFGGQAKSWGGSDPPWHLLAPPLDIRFRLFGTEIITIRFAG